MSSDVDGIPATRSCMTCTPNPEMSMVMRNGPGRICSVRAGVVARLRLGRGALGLQEQPVCALQNAAT
jgi:hypothetical protein